MTFHLTNQYVNANQSMSLEPKLFRGQIGRSCLRVVDYGGRFDCRVLEGTFTLFPAKPSLLEVSEEQENCYAVMQVSDIKIFVIRFDITIMY